MTLCCWKCILTTDPDQRRKLQLSRERKRIHEEIEKGKNKIWRKCLFKIRLLSYCNDLPT